MLWKDRQGSGNVLDQRRLGGKGLGIGGLAFGAVVIYLLGGNPLAFIASNLDSIQPSQSRPATQHEEDLKQFSSVVLKDTEDVWNANFQKANQSYAEPQMVLFTNAVSSACGRASSATGPFYCPNDRRVYLDLGFFDELGNRFGAKGDFAAAYVIAHEVGHHVQNQLGLLGKSNDNASSVKIELQADCLAGVWAGQTERAKNVVEPGDIDEALNAASMIGDDRLQKMQQGHVVPDSFTHGSSAQRVSAFKKGYDGGELKTCL